MFQPRILGTKIYRCDVCITRLKNKLPDHWANKLKKTNPANLALKHFDEFYKKFFKHEWPSIRISLLTQHKYVALVNNFGEVEKTMDQLESLGSISIRQVYEIYQEKLKDEEGEGRRASSNEQYKEKMMKMTGNIEDIEDKKGELREERRRARDMKNREEEDTTNKKSELDYSSSYQSLQASIESAELDTHRLVSPDNTSATGLQDFIPATELKGMEDFISDQDYIDYLRPSPEVDFKIVQEPELHISPYLHVYSFPRGDISEFPRPRRGVTGVYNFYCMDGASILPVLALNIQPYDTVLDMCAAPGGKTLVALQTLYPDLIVANDLERSKRLLSVMDQYMYDFNPRTDKRVQITNRSGLDITEENTYDKILVDVPCTNDRLSVTDDFNNIFNPIKLKDRLQMPEVQSALLTQALKLVKVGGSVVYSTCSLSPIQNDGVVMMSLKRLWEETNHEIHVKDLSAAVKPLKSLFSFSTASLTYGHLIKPYLPNNFGPMYFCKFDKIK